MKTYLLVCEECDDQIVGEEVEREKAWKASEAHALEERHAVELYEKVGRFEAKASFKSAEKR